ncbi:MAG: RNA-binding protein [Peptococcaceae bacterium]|nr:RNA-binding protein [Peptococcaceae bacterium]MDH7524423.1 RNA-binding protein [Peptococcaceae bacterium]
MSKTLYVGNLPWATSPQELADLFSSYGQVISTRIIKDKETNRSRGFGFVEVADEDVENMIASVDGKEFNGRILSVNEAKSREQ